MYSSSIPNLESELTEARGDFLRAMNKLRELEDIERLQIVLPQMREKIGTHYKYRNSYSCPQTDADYWWLYAKVIGVTDEGRYVLLKFSVDTGNKLLIEQDEWSTGWGELSSGFQPIERGEFLAAVQPMLSGLQEKIL